MYVCVCVRVHRFVGEGSAEDDCKGPWCDDGGTGEEGEDPGIVRLIRLDRDTGSLKMSLLRNLGSDSLVVVQRSKVQRVTQPPFSRIGSLVIRSKI